jgi:hypothetical protein
MAGTVNKVILIGNLGRDPEIRTTQDGSKITHLSVATTDTWRDRNSGERRERTEWHRVVIFNDKLGEVAEKYLRKGSNWARSPRSTFARAPKSTSRAPCRPASGPTSRARSATPPRSSCSATAAR